jgi:hypothetical protein
MQSRLQRLAKGTTGRPRFGDRDRGAAKLEAQNVTTPTALNGLAPNLNISQGSGYGTSLNVTLRGVNQADNVLTNDARVALYPDGVYMGGRWAACSTWST